MSLTGQVSGQRSFEDLGTPLHDVTFCVIDLETTGGSPQRCGITEIGAALFRGGERVGTFQTLINPGMAIPPEIVLLTSITDAMVYPAPRIEAVLPSLLEFIGPHVVVGHNVRFDLGFINAALERTGRARLANQAVDTVALARRLVRDEVPNCKLGTLARRFGLPHQPNHRALDDALATGDLLHLLLERAAGLGVSGLDDLLTLPTMAGHAQAPKLNLTTGLPRKSGVYLFRDINQQVLYVGKATNLRARVRSYFSGDERRKVGRLLQQLHTIDHFTTINTLDAAVLEVRLIQRYEPQFNQQLKRWPSYRYVKLTNERFPRLSVTKAVKDDGGTYLGPLSSTRAARTVIEAIETAVPIRRCATRSSAGRPTSTCSATALGIGTCPCSGSVGEEDYQLVVDQVIAGWSSDADLLLGPLETKMNALAESELYEEAAAIRDLASGLANALIRRHKVETVRAAGRVIVTTADGSAEIDHGILVRTWSNSTVDTPHLPGLEAPRQPITELVDLDLPPAPDQIDELLCVANWLEKHAARLRVSHYDQPLVPSLAGLRRFDHRPSDLE